MKPALPSTSTRAPIRREYLAAILVVLLLTTWLDTNRNYLNKPEESAINLTRTTSRLALIALGEGLRQAMIGTPLADIVGPSVRTITTVMRSALDVLHGTGAKA